MKPVQYFGLIQGLYSIVSSYKARTIFQADIEVDILAYKGYWLMAAFRTPPPRSRIINPSELVKTRMNILG